MKALRELLDHPPRGPKRTVPSVTILSMAERLELQPDLTQAFDRARFGCSPEEVRGYEPEQLHLVELVWEALEAASVPLDELGRRSIGLSMAVDIDPTPIHTWLGLDGPVDVYPSTPWGILSAFERAAGSSGVTTDLSLVALPLEDGLAVLCVGAGHLSDVGSRLARVLACARATTLEVASARATDASGAIAPERVAVDDARTIVQALLGKEPIELVSEGEGGAVVVHLVQEHAPAADGNPPSLLRLSSSSRSDLRDLVGKVVQRLQTPTDLRSLAVDASRRAPLDRRIAVPTRDLDAVTDRLGAWLAGDRDAVAYDKVTGKGTAFVFPPAGAQYANMGGSLYDHEPAFREAIMACDRLLRHQMPRPLLSLMFPQPGREHPLADPLVASPLTFVLAWSLSKLLQTRGVEPQHVLGCGVGELVAAVVAGAIPLEGGLKLAVARGKLLRSVADEGARVVVTGSESQARELIDGIDGLDVVAVPVPHKAVVGGRVDAVKELLARAEEQKVRVERVAGHPGHTPLVDGLLDEYRAVAETIPCRRPELHWVSSSSGELVEGIVDADHWVATLRSTIRFAVACETAYFDGSRTFVELAPRPVMVGAGRRTLGHLPVRFVSALLGPEQNDRDALDEVLAVLWSRGIDLPPDLAGRGQGVPLPVTRWDRRPLDSSSEEEPESPLLRPPTLVPDDEEEIQSLMEDAVQAAADGALDDYDDGSPSIAPPSLMEDITKHDETAQRPMDDPDISTFFGEEDEGPKAPLPELPDVQVGGLAKEAWEPIDAPSARDTERTTWVVMVDEEGLGDYLLSLLGGAGHDGWRVLESLPIPRNDGTIFIPEPHAPEAWDELLERLGTLEGPVKIVHLWSLDHRRHQKAWLALVRLVETFHMHQVPAPIYLVTRGLFSSEPDPALALLWGVGRRMAVEAPRQWGGCIDLDEAEDAEALLEHLLERGSPTEVSFEGAQRRVRMLRALTDEESAADAPSYGGTWAVVGPPDEGSLEIVRGLARMGVEKVLLVADSAPTADVTMAILGLGKEGVRCTIVRADPRNEDDQVRLQERIEREGGVQGVLVRVAGSRHQVLKRAGDVGVRQVSALEAVPFLLGLAEQRILWLPADALEAGSASPWSTVLAPAAAQLAQARGGAVLCGDTEPEVVGALLEAARPREVVVRR